MKKLVFSLFVFLFTFSIHAQMGVSKKGLKDAELIKKLPLLVVLHEYDDPFYKKMNKDLKDAVLKYWNYSKTVEFISKEKLREYSKDKTKQDQYAYLMYSDKTYQGNVPAGCFCVGLLNKHIFTHYRRFGNPGKKYSKADYKHGLTWLQKDLEILAGYKGLKEKRKFLATKFHEQASSSTLLVDEDLIEEELKEKFGDLYHYDYRITNKEEVDKAIIENTPNILYFKPLQHVDRPTVKTSANRTEIGVGGNGNNNYNITETKTIRNFQVLINFMFRADNDDLVMILWSGGDKIRSKEFKKSLSDME